MTESAEGISTEIARSVGSIWERRSGTRATSVSTTIEGDAVRCTIEGGEAGDGTSTGYQHEASAAVTRISKRKVCAYIDKRDKQTGVATQTFILDPVRTKY